MDYGDLEEDTLYVYQALCRLGFERRILLF